MEIGINSLEEALLLEFYRPKKHTHLVWGQRSLQNPSISDSNPEGLDGIVAVFKLFLQGSQVDYNLTYHSDAYTPEV